MEFRGRFLVLVVESPYDASFIVYFFTSDVNLSMIRETAEQLISTVKKRSPMVEYIGVEPLPFEGEGYVIVQDEPSGFRLVHNTIPSQVFKKLEEYRARRLTLDLDSDLVKGKNGALLLQLSTAVQALRKYPLRVYETHAGYHVIAELPEPLPFQQRIAIRRGLGDDPKRIDYDLTLQRIGLRGLTDIMFTYKWWYGQENFHEWREIPSREVPILLPSPARLPKGFKARAGRGTVEYMEFMFEPDMSPASEPKGYLVFRGVEFEEAVMYVERLRRKMEDIVHEILSVSRREVNLEM